MTTNYINFPVSSTWRKTAEKDLFRSVIGTDARSEERREEQEALISFDQAMDASSTIWTPQGVSPVTRTPVPRPTPTEVGQAPPESYTEEFQRQHEQSWGPSPKEVVLAPTPGSREEDLRLEQEYGLLIEQQALEELVQLLEPTSRAYDVRSSLDYPGEELFGSKDPFFGTSDKRPSDLVDWTGGDPLKGEWPAGGWGAQPPEIVSPWGVGAGGKVIVPSGTDLDDWLGSIELIGEVGGALYSEVLTLPRDQYQNIQAGEFLSQWRNRSLSHFLFDTSYYVDSIERHQARPWPVKFAAELAFEATIAPLGVLSAGASLVLAGRRGLRATGGLLGIVKPAVGLTAQQTTAARRQLLAVQKNIRLIQDRLDLAEQSAKGRIRTESIDLDFARSEEFLKGKIGLRKIVQDDPAQIIEYDEFRFLQATMGENRYAEDALRVYLGNDALPSVPFKLNVPEGQLRPGFDPFLGLPANKKYIDAAIQTRIGELRRNLTAAEMDDLLEEMRRMLKRPIGPVPTPQLALPAGSGRTSPLGLWWISPQSPVEGAIPLGGDVLSTVTTPWQQRIVRGIDYPILEADELAVRAKQIQDNIAELERNILLQRERLATKAAKGLRLVSTIKQIDGLQGRIAKLQAEWRNLEREISEIPTIARPVRPDEHGFIFVTRNNSVGDRLLFKGPRDAERASINTSLLSGGKILDLNATDGEIIDAYQALGLQREAPELSSDIVSKLSGLKERKSMTMVRQEEAAYMRGEVVKDLWEMSKAQLHRGNAMRALPPGTAPGDAALREGMITKGLMMDPTFQDKGRGMRITVPAVGVMQETSDPVEAAIIRAQVRQAYDARVAADRVAERAVTAERAAPGVAGPVPETEVVDGIAEALKKQQAFLDMDSPSFFGRFLDALPGVKEIRSVLWRNLPDQVQVAYLAEESVASALRHDFGFTRYELFKVTEKMFGPGSLDGIPTKVRYIGPPDEIPSAYTHKGKTIELVHCASPCYGSLLDVFQRPQYYDLSDEQSQFLLRWRKNNSDNMQRIIREYGGKWHEYVPDQQGAVFISNVDINDDVLTTMDMTPYEAILRGRGATRYYDSAASRMLKNPEFHPHLSIRDLQYGMDEWKSRQAGRETFLRGVGGKTRVELMDELKPGLRQKKEYLASRVHSLGTRLSQLSPQVTAISREQSRTRTKMAQIDKKIDALQDDIAGMDQDMGPELSYIYGRVDELSRTMKELESWDEVLDTRIAARGATGTTIMDELDQLVVELTDVRRQYRAGNLQGYALVEEDVFRYFPAKDAAVIEDLRKVSNNRLVRLIEEWRGTAFAGDMSPFLGVQLPIGAIFNAKMAASSFTGAVKDSIRSRDVLHIFRQGTMADVLAADMDGWRDLAFYAGLDPRGGTPQEFSGGLLRKIPGFTRFNESMYALVLRQTKNMYDNQLVMAQELGWVGEDAKAYAADMATKVYPMWRPRRFGLSGSRAALARFPLTSISFLAQPAALMTEAATGFVKLAARQPQTLQEKLAMRLMLNAAGTAMGLSVSSNVVEAMRTGQDPQQAAFDAINPLHSNFLTAVMFGRRLPLGGPFRAMIRAIAPREVEGVPVPVPFAGIFNFARARVTPAIRTQVVLALETAGVSAGFHGERILRGNPIEQLMRGVAYELEGMLPLTASAVVGGMRREQDTWTISEEMFWQFMGSNLYRESAWQARDAQIYRWAKKNKIIGTEGEIPKTWAELYTGQRNAFETAFPIHAENIKKEIKRQANIGVEWAENAQTAEDLREKYRKQQLDDDLLLNNYFMEAIGYPNISPEVWQRRRRNRATELYAKLSQVFADFDEEDPKTPVDHYRLKYSELQKASGGQMRTQDYEEIDGWVASQTMEWRIIIEEHARGSGITPMTNQYYEGRRLPIVQGYYDIEKEELAKVEVEFQSQYTLWKAAGGAERATLAGPVRRLIDIIRQRKLEYRNDNPEVDEFLYRFGLGGSPASPALKEAAFNRAVDATRETGIMDLLAPSPAQGSIPAAGEQPFSAEAWIEEWSRSRGQEGVPVAP